MAASLLALAAFGCGDDEDPATTQDTTVIETAAETTPEVEVVPEVVEEVVTPIALPGFGSRLELTPEWAGLAIQPSLAWGRHDPGRLAVAWTGKPTDGGGLAIVLGIWDVDDDGYHVKSQPKVINADRTGMRNEPVVCGLEDGGFVVAWSIDRQDGSSNNLGIGFRRVDSDGDPRDENDHVVTTDRSGNHWLVDIACRPAGGFVMTGVRPAATAGVGFEVFVQRFAADGAPDDAPMAPLEQDAGGQAFPVVGVDQRDDLWVAWENTASPDAVTTIVAKRLLKLADPLPEVEIVATSSDATAALIAVDPQGHALVGGLAGTKLNLKTLVAGSPAEPVTIPDTNGAVTVAAASAMADDRFAVVYYLGTGSAVDARFGVVESGAFGTMQTVASGNFPLPYRPAIAANGGNVAVAWTESLGAGEYAVHVSAFAD